MLREIGTALFLTPYKPTQLHPFHYIVGGMVTAWLVLCHCGEPAIIMTCRCLATVPIQFHIMARAVANGRVGRVLA